ALARQRFWLSILVALSLVGVAYFAMRGRPSNSSGAETETKPVASETAAGKPTTTAKGTASKASPKSSAPADKTDKSDSTNKTS
ncbi:MAG TPA: hypothetical protein DCL95_16240, partial [Rhodospirillaceae bacterium]|nr:hypothetical protein [Rhodospirillaceae bacterium]